MEKQEVARVHPLAMLFPNVIGTRFDELVKDIRKKGLLNPVVRHKGVILDGRTRLRACKSANVHPRFIEFSSLGLKCSPEEYIWSANIERRHLTDDQRTVLAFEWANVLRGQARERQREAGKKKTTLAGAAVHTRKAIAERARVTVHKVQQLETVKKHAPTLVPKVAAGSMKLKDAAKAAKRRSGGRPRAVPVKVRNPLHPSQAVSQVMDSLAAEVKVILLRVESKHQEAFFDMLARRVETWCNKKSKAA